MWIQWHGSVPNGPALAYIGPGAGFAFLGSFLSLVVGALVGVFSFLTWPLRVAWRTLRRGRGFRRAKVKRAIFLGLDGLDPRLTEQFMSEGKLPNLAKLASLGSYSRLRTTFPSLSPVAWSTFATGVNPAKHNIFDFLDRDLKSYLPQLSSARVGRPTRVLRMGRLRIPLHARGLNSGGGANHSGLSSVRTVSLRRYFVFPSVFPRRSSMANSFRRCARRISRAPREASRSLVPILNTHALRAVFGIR